MTGQVIISGATGSIGNSLSKALHEAGRNIAVVTRDMDRARKSVPYASEFCRWDQEDTEQLSKFCEGADAIVNLSGAPIFERWKGNYEKEVNDSRIMGTRHIVDAITKCSEKPRVFINGSAAGFYGYKGNVVASESSSAGKDYWADLVERWEKEALRAQESGIRTVLIRTSLVLKRSEGALGSLEPYFRKIDFQSRISSFSSISLKIFSYFTLSSSSTFTAFESRSISSFLSFQRFTLQIFPFGSVSSSLCVFRKPLSSRS